MKHNPSAPGAHPSHRVIKSPVGALTLVSADGALVAVLWEQDDPLRVRIERGCPDNGAHPVLVEAAQQLAEYFAEARQSFDLKLAFHGTAFQVKVWNALLTIPFGQTRSYGEIAQQIGHPSAVRAVGAANGRNPLSIIAPCHRVVGADGALTGFAGGLPAKSWLLALEQRARQPSLWTRPWGGEDR